MVHLKPTALALFSLFIVLSTAALALLALASTSDPVLFRSSNTTTKSFSGTGQIRTLSDGSSHEDLGCLTASGRWTIDENACGIFVAVRKGGDSIGATQFTLASKEAGPCEILETTFVCEKGMGGYTFGGAPPNVDEKPMDLRFTSYVEKGKYVWLTWSPKF